MANVGTVDFSSTIAKIDKITEQAKMEIAKALYVSGLKIEENALISISQTGTGRVYDWRSARDGEKPDSYIKIGGNTFGVVKRNTPHVASAPGAPPATDEGDLKRTLHTIKIGADGFAVDVKAGGGEIGKRAIWLEYGTSKMEARPFMKPALEKSRKFIHDRMEKAVQKVIAQNAVK